ncbi:MAG: acetoacetate metabolism regulatory protein atoc [Pseudomonadota bacterium]|jgi:hemerythrin-like domain-containing protein
MTTATTPASTADIQRSMREDHARLERVFDAVLAAFQADARAESSALWSRFESGMRRHLELEERHMLPRFQRSHPQQAARLALEHAAIVDLFYRLNVVMIETPPLRARPSDIALLALRFLRKFASENGKEILGISARTIQYRLREYAGQETPEPKPDV